MCLIIWVMFMLLIIKKNSILWAKNYKIPFRSNLNFDSKLVVSNQTIVCFFF